MRVVRGRFQLSRVEEKRVMSQFVTSVSKADELAKNFRKKWLPVLLKQISKFQSQVVELVRQPLESGECDPERAELSIHAQFLLEESLKKFSEIMTEMLQEHRQIHPPISKCGKDLDRYFQMDLSGLMRCEKNLESLEPDNPHRPVVNKLIYEHFLSLGRVEIADIFMRECPDSKSFVLPSEENLELMRSVMEPFRLRQFQPAIKWIEENAPDEQNLLFRLHAEQILQFLETNKKKEAILYCRALQPFADDYKTEIQRLMFMAVSWSADAKQSMKERYENMFPEGRWITLEQELAACFSEYRDCPLANLVNIGAKAIPTLLKMHTLIRRGTTSQQSQNHFTPLPSTVPFEDITPHTLVEELFCEVPVGSRVHSSFCCPVLRTQASETNPPMRLHCGHVISADALTRLSANRAQRVKCPYCPEESNAADAIRIYF